MLNMFINCEFLHYYYSSIYYMNNRIELIRQYEFLIKQSNYKGNILSNDKMTRSLQNFIISKYEFDDMKQVFFQDLNVSFFNFFNKNISLIDIFKPIEYVKILYSNFKCNNYKFFHVKDHINIIYDTIYYIKTIDNLDYKLIEIILKHNLPFVIDLSSKKHNLKTVRIVYLPDYHIRNDNFDLEDILSLWCVCKFNKILIK